MNKGSIIIKLSMFLFSTIGLWQYVIIALYRFAKICFKRRFCTTLKEITLQSYTYSKVKENNYPI